jgi:RHS repeat-associated protein
MNRASWGRTAWRSLAIGFAALGALLSAPSAVAEIKKISPADALAACGNSGLNTDPWQSGIALAQPGRWWNEKRYGTGWDLVYNDDRSKLKVFLYTFNDAGHSTWLTTPMEYISTDGQTWTAPIHKYKRLVSAPETVGEVTFRFFRDDPSRLAVRWRWNAIPLNLQSAEGSLECLADMTRLNPTYYSGSVAPIVDDGRSGPKTVMADSIATSVFSGYWSSSTASPPDPNAIPGVVMTIMQTSLGNSIGHFGEAAVFLTYDTRGQGEPVFVQAQRETLLPSLPLTSDTFNLFYHYGIGFSNGYAVTDCPNATTVATNCNNNINVGTYTRRFLPQSNYRSVDTSFFIDPTKLNNGAVPSPKVPGNPTFLSAASNQGGIFQRISRLREISVNQYVCQAPVGGSCNVWVNWAGDGVGKPWRRDLTTLQYFSNPISQADFGISQELISHGDRVQFELWQGMPGTPGAQLLDRTPEVRGVGPTPAPNAPIEVPDAHIYTTIGDLPDHDATVGAVPGAADVSGGAATYTMPIEVPPGRNGMQPMLSLDYSSRNGNGVAGFGWKLSGASSLTRCGRTLDQDGITRGVRLDGSDRLCLDGERLVATEGGYGNVGAIYRTELDRFARVKQTSGELASGEACFRVEQKNGRVLTYGCAPPDSQCPSGSAPPRVRRSTSAPAMAWLVSRAEDRTGNYMDYCYREFGTSTGEVLLDRVVYTGHTSGALGTPDRSVRFHYAERPSLGQANDRSSSGLAGQMLQQTQRLSSVTTHAPGSAMPAREYELDYTIGPVSPSPDYSIYSGRSLLRRMRICAYGVGQQRICPPATEFTWSDGNWLFPSRRLVADSLALAQAGTAPSVSNGQNAYVPERSYNHTETTGDLDGDGTREMWNTVTVGVGANSVGERRLMKVNADRVVQGSVLVTALDPANAVEGSEFADFDGDGASEILSATRIFKWKRARGAPLCDNGAVSCTADSSSLFRSVTHNLPLYGNRLLTRIADFNGDGAPDALLRYPPGTPCDPANGDAGGAQLCLFLNAKPGVITEETTQFHFGSAIPVAVLDSSNDKIGHVADFDGDGVNDIFVDKFGKLDRILLVRATAAGGISVETRTAAAIGANSSVLVPRWMDVNGDGLDDYVTIDLPGVLNERCPGISPFATGQTLPETNRDCFGRWWIQINKGGTLAEKVQPENPSNVGSPGLRFDRLRANNQPVLRYASKMIQTDVDSDGRVDLLYPAKLAARICLHANLKANLFIHDRGDDNCVGNGCTANVCAPAPPEELSTWDFHPEPEVIESADMFTSGLGEMDPSVYRFNAIRFVQTGENAFRIQIDETPIIAATGAVGEQRGRIDDYYGDGLADIVSRVSCPFRPATDWPQGACTLATGGRQGPGSPTSYLDSAQTIQLGQLTDFSTLRLLINENVGDGARAGAAPQLPDLLVKVTEGTGDFAQWDYYPLSSDAGRSGDFPLYKTDLGYIDQRHLMFRSSLPVVSTMQRPNAGGGLSIFGARTVRYSYEGAVLNTAGRGFQGFRAIGSESVGPAARLLRTTTRFHQKFPLTGLIESIQTRLPGSSRDDGLVATQTQEWRCDKNNTGLSCPGQQGGAPPRDTIYAPFLHKQIDTRYDLYDAERSVASTVGSVETLNFAEGSSASGWDSYGNLLRQRVVRKDGDGSAAGNYVAEHITDAQATYDTVTAIGQWWIDKLDEKLTTTSVRYHARDGVSPPDLDVSAKLVRNTFVWNTGNRTLDHATTTDLATGQWVKTTSGYPAVNAGLATSLTVSGSGIAPERRTQMALTADGYFTREVTAMLSATDPSRNHVTRSVTRASDGRVSSTTDADGLTRMTSYDPFGRAYGSYVLGKDGVTLVGAYAGVALQRCAPCSGSGEQRAAYYASSAQDGSPSKRTWFDALGREIKTAKRGFDGRWVNVLTTYDNMGAVQQTSAPHFDGETPLWTQYTYDRAGRVLTRRSPTTTDAAQDAIVKYDYRGLRTDVTKTLATPANCSVAPNLCSTLSRYINSLGQLMRTRDALNGATDYWLEPLGGVAALRDAANNSTTATFDAFGNRLKIVDPNQGTWNFTYNAVGDLLTQVDARGVKTEVTQRDGIGRMLERTRMPTIGMSAGLADQLVRDSWIYDTSGSKGQLAVTQRERAFASTRTPNYEQVWKESYVYSADTGQIESRRTEMEELSRPLEYRYAYDSYYRNLKAITYPNEVQPLTVWKRYNRYGMLTSLTDARLMTPMWSASAADAFGNFTQEQFGYALFGSASYNRATGEMLTQGWRPFEVPTFTHEVDHFDYGYDARGNLTSRNRTWRRYEKSAGHANLFLGLNVPDHEGLTKERFNYDALQRLRSVDASRSQVVGDAWDDDVPVPTTRYDYDAVGNFTYKSGFAERYVYGGAGHTCGPNGVVQTERGPPGETITHTYTCDRNGNQIGESEGVPVLLKREIDYDGANLPTRVAHGDPWNGVGGALVTTRFAYDVNDRRYQRKGTNEAVFYGAHGYEMETSATPGWRMHRIDLGPVVYTRVVTGSSPNLQAEPALTAYVLRDRLGSSVAIADRWGHFNGTKTTNQEIIEDGLTRRSYDAFGAPRQPAFENVVLPPYGHPYPMLRLGPATRDGFTGHEHIDDAKLIHMNGRVYDYRAGRFLGVDPIIQFPLNGQSLNPYSYILNNPLGGTDPSGYKVERTGSVCDRIRSACGGDMSPMGVMPANESRNGARAPRVAGPPTGFSTDVISSTADSARRFALAIGDYDDPVWLDVVNVVPGNYWDPRPGHGFYSAELRMFYELYPIAVGNDVAIGLGVTVAELYSCRVSPLTCAIKHGLGVEIDAPARLGYDLVESYANDEALSVRTYEIKSNFVFRSLANDDDPAIGLFARDPNAEDDEHSHVAGKKDSQWISTTKSLTTAMFKFRGAISGNGVVRIDLRKVGSPISDVSGGFPDKGGRWHYAAIKDQEVLIKGYIPPEAMEWVKKP